jgi:hypothetical protein
MSYYNEQEQKLKALQDETAGKVGWAPPPGNFAPQGATDGCGLREETLAERLQYEHRHADKAANDKGRALHILSRHPEFEDFLWLIRSGVV